MASLRPKLQNAVRRRQKSASYKKRRGRVNPMTSMKRKMTWSMMRKHG